MSTEADRKQAYGIVARLINEHMVVVHTMSDDVLKEVWNIHDALAAAAAVPPLDEAEK